MKVCDVLIVVGGALGTYLGLKFVWQATRKALPKGTTNTNVLPPAPPPAPPQLMVGEMLPLLPGKRYFATVMVGFPASLGASPSAIIDLATKKGFVNVGVTEGQRPAGWPGSSTGDYYVSGEYRGSQSSINRQPGGGVNVVEAFVL